MTGSNSVSALRRSPGALSTFILYLLLGCGAARSLELPRYPAPEETVNNAVSAHFGLQAYTRNLLRDMEHATRSIYIDKYILGGESGLEVARMLEKKHREGLDVRILLDGRFGSVGQLKEQVLDVRKYIEEVGLPFRLGATRRGGTFIRRWTEDHNKIAIIDARIGYIGGTNIADFFTSWNDLMVRIDGPSASQLARQFEYDWVIAGGTREEIGGVPDLEYPHQGCSRIDRFPASRPSGWWVPGSAGPRSGEPSRTRSGPPRRASASRSIR